MNHQVSAIMHSPVQKLTHGISLKKIRIHK
jgi:hypothetical protein